MSGHDMMTPNRAPDGLVMRSWLRTQPRDTESQRKLLRNWRVWRQLPRQVHMESRYNYSIMCGRNISAWFSSHPATLSAPSATLWFSLASLWVFAGRKCSSSWKQRNDLQQTKGCLVFAKKGIMEIHSRGSNITNHNHHDQRQSLDSRSHSITSNRNITRHTLRMMAIPDAAGMPRWVGSRYQRWGWAPRDACGFASLVKRAAKSLAVEIRAACCIPLLTWENAGLWTRRSEANCPFLIGKALSSLLSRLTIKPMSCWLYYKIYCHVYPLIMSLLGLL